MCILGNISRCHHSYPPLFIPLTEMEELSFLQGIFCNWSLHCYNIYILVYNRIIIVTIILILVSSGPVGNPHTTPANGYLHSCLYYTQLYTNKRKLDYCGLHNSPVFLKLWVMGQLQLGAHTFQNFDVLP